MKVQFHSLKLRSIAILIKKCIQLENNTKKYSRLVTIIIWRKSYQIIILENRLLSFAFPYLCSECFPYFSVRLPPMLNEYSHYFSFKYYYFPSFQNYKWELRRLYIMSKTRNMHICILFKRKFEAAEPKKYKRNNITFWLKLCSPYTTQFFPYQQKKYYGMHCDLFWKIEVVSFTKYLLS